MFSTATQIVSKSIFPIFHYGPAGCGVLGTGFFIDNKGYFLTAAHVINALPKGQQLGYLGNIPLANFKGKGFIPLEIIANDVDKDLAMGLINQEVLPALKFAEEHSQIGQSISLCGYPLPMIQLTQKKINPVTKQIGVSFDVSSVRQYWQPSIKIDEFKPNFILHKKFQSFITQHAALPGMSGGPVFNIAGEVVGVTSAVWPRKVPLNAKQNIDIANGVAVELDEIKSFVESTRLKRSA